ncbi:NDP-sugar synthase [Euryarchaeota archaeon]|jgi:mannose-1-phosphate guanylyltransferase|nr:NDP-sugar synthase [Euryarchaeota archaeon]
MEAIILVGGFGTRLRPLTLTVPKPLLPLANIPMVERMIRNLPEIFDTAILAVNYGLNDMRKYFEGRDIGKKVIIVPEEEPLGTGGAMRNCIDYVTGTTAVFNGDVVSSINLNEMLEQHIKTKAKGTLALWKVKDPSRFGVVEFSNGEILQFQEKPEKGSELSNLINAGTYLLELEILEMIPPNQKISIERDIYPKVAGNGLHGFPFEGYFIDSGTPESYLEANFKSIGNNGTASHTGASIRGSVMIHEDAKLEHCIIGPNVIIGPKVKLEKCVIRNSVILSNVNSYGAVIEDSIIGPNIQVKNDIKQNLISPEGKIAF